MRNNGKKIRQTARRTGDTKVAYLLGQTRPYHNLLGMTSGADERTFYWDGSVAAMSETMAAGRTEEESRSVLHYYLQDELGSPLRVSGYDRDYLTYGYDEFGNDLYNDLEEAGIPNPYSRQGEEQPFGYTGYRHDGIGGTYFAQAREYQPQNGRFTAEDVIKGNGAFPETLNRYGYCLGNPVGLVDLDGLTPKEKVINYYVRKLGDRENEIELYYELTDAVDSYANDLQLLATLPYNNNYEAMQKVLGYDQEITAAAKKYDIEKEMIQAVLFQEIRFYNVGDPIGDSLVRQSFAYDERLKAYVEGEVLFAPQAVLGYRRSSSTGLGQIHTSTAIDAINSYNERNSKNDNSYIGKIYDLDILEDREEIWYALQDDSYSIEMVALVLLYEKRNRGDEWTIRNVLKAYNGSGELAEKYATVALQYYEAFKKYNASIGKGCDQQ